MLRRGLKSVAVVAPRDYRGERTAGGRLVEEGGDEGVAVEGDEVFELFAGAGVDDGEVEFGGDREDDAALGGAVEFGEDDAGAVGGFGEEAGLLEAVLSGGGVHDEEGLVGCAGDLFFGGAAHFTELFHEVGLGVEAAGGVDDEDLGGAGAGGGAGVVEGGGGVAALAGFDDGGVGAGGPDL